MSLADKISDLLNAAPVSIDPEDEALDSTKAQTVEHASEETEFEENESSLRKRSAVSLLDEDERYAGQVVSRKRLRDSDDEEETYSDDLDEGEDEASVQSGTEEEKEEEEESSAEGAESESDNDGEEHPSELTDDNFKHMKSTDVPLEKKKGVCVRNQISIWESILEMRIQMQKCLIAANKMPQKEVYKQMEVQSESEFCDKAKDVKSSVTALLEKFLVLQSVLLSQYPETKTLLSKKVEKEEKVDDDDEEIPSEDEEIPSEDEEIPSEDEKNKAQEVESSILHKAKRRKMEYYAENLTNFHQKYKPYCNSVIQKWNDKTRILSKGNEGTSVLNHIQYALSDKAKLLKKTQLKRSNYQIVGAENNEEYSTEIFDDDDFYHQLLRELIEFRSADLTDPVQLSRQWIQLQNARSKMKRNIDTRATKGRKIRYAVHSKLVNFMAPIDEGTWTEEAKTDLFKSLFRHDQNAKSTA